MLSIGNVGANNISLFYADKYVIYQFLENDNLASINIENINESYDFVLSQEEPVMTNTPSSYPNIIVVMNESWWNTDNIGSSKVTFSSDPMQPFKDLSSMCTTGYLTSNVYGGGTVSSEAEFLTGLDTKYYVSDAGIYSTTLNRKLPSIVDYFNSLDYNTIAIHPYYGSFYDRETIYKTMGFDKTVFDEDMLYRDIYTQYISDESLTKQIIHEYETAPNGNKFIWSVSIGNHIRVLDYDIEPITDYDYPISIELKDENLSEYDYNTLLNYVNGFYYANLAYKELVEYFENVDEPTIVLMYGDHIPNFSEEVRIALGIEGDEKCYNVPVILWSNIQGDMPEFTGEGIYYLPQMLLEYAQMPDSDMQRILRYERNYFKADSRQYILDAFGLQLTQFTKEQVQALKHYKTIEYDLILGDSIGSDVWNPIQ
jgi:phosphoglycerol transferase MdoB-like AlkP superfamily enzyme